MRCPGCRLPLVTAEIGGIELDYCAVELGVWFDEGEIEALLHATGPILPELGAGARGARRCPRCDAKMQVVQPAPGLELDVCPHGDGVWFDKGEVQQLAQAFKQHAALPDARLGEIFDRLQYILGGTQC